MASSQDEKMLGMQQFFKYVLEKMVVAFQQFKCNRVCMQKTRYYNQLV